MKKTLIRGALVLATLLSSAVASAHGNSVPPDPTPLSSSEDARLKELVKRIDRIVAPNGLTYFGRGTPGALVARSIRQYGLPNKGAVIAPLEKIVESHPSDRGKLLVALERHLGSWAQSQSPRMREIIKNDVAKIREQYGATMDGEPDPGQHWEARAMTVRMMAKQPPRTQRVGQRVVATSALPMRPSDAARTAARVTVPSANLRATSAGLKR